MVRLIAKRFAIKEAFAKAVGTGVREPVSLRHISVVHDELGKPELTFAPELQTWLDERNIRRVYISLSDERGLYLRVCDCRMLKSSLHFLNNKKPYLFRNRYGFFYFSR